MSILAQCGWGMAKKVEKGLQGNHISGLILSPKDMDVRKVVAKYHDIKKAFPNAFIIFDPQFYVSVLPDPRDGKLPTYNYYRAHCGLSRAYFKSSNIEHIVHDCIEFQLEHLNGLSAIVSPTIGFSSFSDSWSQIALNMAFESVDQYKHKSTGCPLIVSLLIDEIAFNSKKEMMGFLSALCEIDADGFYIIIRRNDSHSLHITHERFSLILYMTYILSYLNKYRIIFGYCDLYSFLLEAAGADLVGSGWYKNLRMFSNQRFYQSSGGRRPRKRYSSLPLLSSPLLIPEMQEVYQRNELNQVITKDQYSAILSQGPGLGNTQWTDEVSCLANWKTLSTLSRKISQCHDFNKKMETAQKLIDNSLSLYNLLQGLGIDFEYTTGPHHIHEWNKSIKEFKDYLLV